MYVQHKTNIAIEGAHVNKSSRKIRTTFITKNYRLRALAAIKKRKVTEFVVFNKMRKKKRKTYQII